MTGQYHHPELQFIFTALKHQQGVLQNTILRQKKKKKKVNHNELSTDC